jgi:predicted CXXCH cytochrome family protein
MRNFSHDTLLLAFIVLFSCHAVCAAEEMKVNPHSESGDCSICHVAPINKLRGWFVFGSTKREMKTDLNQLCLQCHPAEPAHAGGLLGVGIGHGIGKKPVINHQNLPLASDGTITCAITCHNIHTSPDNPKRLRVPYNSLCVSCHNI